MARVTFLGLNMDATTPAQIVTAIRGLYPQLVGPADSDNRVVQLVLKQIITEHLKAWASRSATADPNVLADEARQQAMDIQSAASAAADALASGDIQPTATT